jgi:hypothetical protein
MYYEKRRGEGQTSLGSRWSRNQIRREESGGQSVIKTENAGNCSGGLKKGTLNRSSRNGMFKLRQPITGPISPVCAMGLSLMSVSLSLCLSVRHAAFCIWNLNFTHWLTRACTVSIFTVPYYSYPYCTM